MEEFVVVGLLVVCCFVLGVTMLADVEVRDPQLRQTVACGVELHIENLSENSAPSPCNTGSTANLDRRFQVFGQECIENEAFDSPRILARRGESKEQNAYLELSDDVLSRYRCFADDLARLRAELGELPPREGNLASEMHGVGDWPKSPELPNSGSPASDQLPVAESVSMRV